MAASNSVSPGVSSIDSFYSFYFWVLCFVTSCLGVFFCILMKLKYVEKYTFRITVSIFFGGLSFSAGVAGIIFNINSQNLISKCFWISLVGLGLLVINLSLLALKKSRLVSYKQTLSSKVLDFLNYFWIFVIFGISWPSLLLTDGSFWWGGLFVSLVISLFPSICILFVSFLKTKSREKKFANIEVLMDMDDIQVEAILRSCSDEDVFKAFIVQSDLLLERCRFAMSEELYNRLISFKDSPFVVKVSDVEESTSRILLELQNKRSK